MPQEIQFLTMRRLVEVTGISKSELYRQIARGAFPAGRAYPHAPSRRFWVASEVRKWQREVLEKTGGYDEYEDLVG